MSDLPWIVKEFLLKLTVNPDCYTFVVMTSNNGKSGNSFVSLSQALSRSGANARQLFNQLRAGKSGTTEKSTGTVKIYHIFYKRTKNKLYI